MRKSGTWRPGWRSRWLRCAYGVSAVFGMGVIAGMMLASRMSRPQVRVGR